MSTARSSIPALPARRSAPGWGGLLLATTSQAYLVLLCTLAGIALLPAVFGWHGTIVQTGSMQPHIAPGDVVVLSQLPEQDPVPMNAVVQFRTEPGGEETGQHFILHRITATHEDGSYTTAGDANIDADLEPLDRDRITGVGRLVVPLIGLPSLWWNTGQYLPLGLWLACTLLALVTLSRSALRASDDAESADSVQGLESLHRPGGLPDGRGRGALIGTDLGGVVAGSTATRFRTGGGRIRKRAGVGSLPRHSARPTPASAQGHVARRAVLGLAGAAVLTGLTAYPGTRSRAALTALTTTGTSFATASSFTPLPSPGRAGAFALLTKVEVMDKIDASRAASSVSGLIGTTAGTIVNFPTTHQNSAEAINAMADAQKLYDELQARPATAVYPGTVASRVLTVPAGATLFPGVYHSTDTVKTSNLILDGQGNPDAVFIMRGGAFDASSTMSLINGAKAANVYWVAVRNVDFRAGSTTVGTWLGVHNGIFELTGTLTGRVLILGGSANPPTGKILTSNTTIRLP